MTVDEIVTEVGKRLESREGDFRERFADLTTPQLLAAAFHHTGKAIGAAQRVNHQVDKAEAILVLLAQRVDPDLYRQSLQIAYPDDPDYAESA